LVGTHPNYLTPFDITGFTKIFFCVGVQRKPISLLMGIIKRTHGELVIFGRDFDVSLTVHLSITLDNGQLNAQIF
jgi:hypothetical protein